MHQPLQVAHACLQRVEVDEVERQVQLPQELAGAMCVCIWGQWSPATLSHQAMCFNEPRSLFMMRMHPPEPLHAREVVERDVQVLQLLEVVQVSESVDHVVLQVQDLEPAARGAQHLVGSALGGGVDRLTGLRLR